MAVRKRQIIIAEKAPAAIGPYSTAIRAEGLIFLAGQIGLDPETRQLVPGGIEAETRQALTNIASVLEAAGSSMEMVVKTTVFMANLDEFKEMNRVYGTFFMEDPPARSTVEAAALPAGAAVEIEAIAVVGQSRGD